MSAALLSSTTLQWAVGGMAVSGAVTTVVGTGNQISQDWINVRLKESEWSAQGVGLIQPPPIQAR